MFGWYFYIILGYVYIWLFFLLNTNICLLSQAWRLWTDNKILDLMDETLRDTCIADQFVKCINIGLLCVQDDPSDRPTMSNVIKMLDSEITNLPTPKQPAFFIIRDQSSSTSYNRPKSNNELTNSLDGRWCVVIVLMSLVILLITPSMFIVIHKEIM